MSVVTAITDVFDAVSDWLIQAMQTATSLFYDATGGSLTFLGVLVVIGLAIGIVFLLIGVIQNFLRLRS